MLLTVTKTGALLLSVTGAGYSEGKSVVKEVKEKRCAFRCGRMAAWGHAVCKECLPKVPVRKPIEETLAMIDEVLDGR